MSLEELREGQAVDAERLPGSSYRGVAHKIDLDKEMVYVKFPGFGDSWDEWMPADKVRGRNSEARNSSVVGRHIGRPGGEDDARDRPGALKNRNTALAETQQESETKLQSQQFERQYRDEARRNQADVRTARGDIDKVERQLAKRLQTVEDRVAAQADVLKNNTKLLSQPAKSDPEIATMRTELAAVSLELQRTAQTQDATIQQLLGENRDQREAIDALMDMLQTTLTHDDANGMFDEFGSSVEKKMAEQEGQLLTVHETVTAQLEAMSATMAANLEAVGREAQQEEARLDGELQLLGRKQGEAVAELAEQLSATDADQDTKRAHLTEDFTLQIDHLKGTVTQSLTSFQTRVDQMSADAESEIHTLGGKLTSQMETFDSRISNSAEALSTKFRNTVDALDSKIKTTADSLRTSIQQVNETTDNRLQHLDSRAEASAVRLHERFDTEWTELKDRVEAGLATGEARVDAEMQNIEDGLGGSMVKLNEAVIALDEKLDRTADALDTRMNDQSGGLDEQMRSLSDQVDRSLTSMDKRVESLTSEIHQILVEAEFDKAIATAAVSQVDDKVVDAVSALSQDLEDQRAKLTSKFEVTRDELAGKFAAQSKMVDEHYAELTGVHNGLNAKFSEHNLQQDLRLDELTSTTRDQHEAAGALLKSLERRLLDKSKSQDAVIETIQKQAGEQIKSLDADYSARLANHDKRMDEDKKRLGDLITRADTKITEKTQELSEAVQGGRDRLFSECSALDTKFTEKIGQQDMRLADKMLAHDQKNDMFEREIRSVQQQMTRATGTLSQLEQDSQEQQRRFAEANASLDTKFAQKSTSHEQALDSLTATVSDNYRVLTDGMKDQDKRQGSKLVEFGSRVKSFATALQGASQRCDEGIAQTNLVMKEENVRVSRLCEGMDVKFTESFRIASTRSETQHAHFTDVCANLDQKYIEKSTSLEQRVADIRAQVVETCNNLESKFEERRVSQERIGDDIKLQMQEMQARGKAEAALTERAQTSR